MNIAIAGKSGSGKDTAADFIMREFFNMQKIMLAQPLKNMISKIF